MLRSALCSSMLLILAAAQSFAIPSLALSSGISVNPLITSGSSLGFNGNIGGWNINSISANGTPLSGYGTSSNPALNLTVNAVALKNAALQPLVVVFTDDAFSDLFPVQFAGSLSANNMVKGMNVSYTAFLNGTPIGTANKTALTTPDVFAGTFNGSFTQLTPYSVSLVIVITPNINTPNLIDAGFSLIGTQTPEPQFYAVLGIGLFCLICYRRRQSTN